MASFDVDDEIEKRYRILRHIGSGAYGVVWCAYDRLLCRQVALKKVFDAFGNQQDAQRTYREVMLLQNLSNNPSIVGLLNVRRADNDMDLYLVFEIIETDLTVILRKEILQDIHRKYLIYQLVRVVAQLHERHIIHRDIKPANVFVNSDCTIKVGDFGLARTFAANVTPGKAVPDMTEYIATRWYRSPEILVKSAVYSTAMDMWSIGCVVGELLIGKPLFMGSSTANQLSLIINAIGAPTADDIHSLNADEAKSVIASLPQTKPEPLTEQLADYDAEAVDLIGNLLVFNPSKRLTALQVLQHPYIAAFVTEVDMEEIKNQTPLALGLPDGQQFSARRYKEHLYENIEAFYRNR